MSESMTEDEAKTMWCPFARAAQSYGEDDVVAVNRVGHRKISEATLCIGSRCMAWRWRPSHGPDPDNPGGDLILLLETWGYCGLAGKP